MAARKLGSILTHFRVLNDPRLESTRRHDLLDIVAITICAVICGADSWVDVKKYGAAKYDWLKGFLKLPNGIPSHDTFGRVFAALGPDEFRACFAAWGAEVADAVGVKHVAIDGKTLRRSRSRGRAALHLVSAWAAGSLPGHRWTVKCLDLPSVRPLPVVQSPASSILHPVRRGGPN